MLILTCTLNCNTTLQCYAADIAALFSLYWSWSSTALLFSILPNEFWAAFGKSKGFFFTINPSSFRAEEPHRLFFPWWRLVSTGKCHFTQILGTWASAERWLSESPICFTLNASQILCAYTCVIWKLNHIFSAWYHSTLAIFCLFVLNLKWCEI